MTDAASPPDIRQTNQDVIARYRASGGTGEGMESLVLITTTGAKTGRSHTTPVCVQEDGDRLVVAGSMGGMRKHPQWFRNLVANPELTVEYRGSTYRARATIVPNGPERDVLFGRMSEVITGLYSYQDRAANHRQIPVVWLERVE
ncbi:MAG TPA: nitroreductase/quinone reductase family protein [Acidimicrobiales bacterium]